MVKIIVAGTRDFNDYDFLKEKLDGLIKFRKNTEIVSGTAKGADLLGEKYANERGFSIKRFSADWDKFGKSAGYKRNEQMAEYADVCVCFWNGKSKGTQHMINLANNHGLKVFIIRYDLIR